MIGVYDIEARDWVRFAVAATWREGDGGPVYHTSARALYDYMRAKGGRWYAHNGGNYDVLFLLGALVHDGATIVTQGSRVLRATVGRGERALHLLDSVKLLPARLAQIGDAVGLPKLEQDYDAVADNVETRRYLARDCEILLKAILWFRELCGGEVPATLATWGIQQIRSYGHPPLRGELNHAFRACVFGGRTEVFRTGLEGKITAADIRSSYARSAMEPLPGRYLGVGARAGALHLYFGAVRVPRMHVPPLPFRHGGRTYYPTGEWSAWVTEVEMEALREAGGDMTVREIHAFAPCDAASRYVRWAWERREVSKGFERLFYKSALNWTLGKLLERTEREKIVKLDDDELAYAIDRHPHGTVVPFAPDLGLYQVPTRAVPVLGHTVAGAWVTGHARARLWRGFVSGRGDPGYGDTDSLIADYRPPLDYGDGCGQWSVEAEFRGRARFEAPKVYYLEDAAGEPVRARAKGFSALGGSPEESDRVDRDTVVRLGMGQKAPLRRLLKCRQVAAAYRRERSAGWEPRVLEQEKGLRDDTPAKRRFDERGRSRPFDVAELLADADKRAALDAMSLERRPRVSARVRAWGGVYAPPAVAGGEWARLYDAPWPGVLRRRPGGVTPHAATERLLEEGYPIALGDEERLRAWLEEDRA